MLKWPAHPDSLYTIVISNLDINPRRNRTLSEFWHWFVANIPGDSVDDGEVIFDLLFPLVLPEGNGDHRQEYLYMLISLIVSFFFYESAYLSIITCYSPGD